MKNAFKDNLWRKVWIGNEVFDSSWCETCYMEAEEWAKKDYPKLKGDKLTEKTLELLDEHYSDEIYGELWCNGTKIFFVGYCDECGTPFIEYGKGDMLELLLNDFFYRPKDKHFNQAEFLKKHYKQVKEIKKIREESPSEFRNEIEVSYKCDFQTLVKQVRDKWGYDILDRNVETIESLV